jgi:hypothetical protein
VQRSAAVQHHGHRLQRVRVVGDNSVAGRGVPADDVGADLVERGMRRCLGVELSGVGRVGLPVVVKAVCESHKNDGAQ